MHDYAFGVGAIFPNVVDVLRILLSTWLGKPDPLSNCSILNQTFDMLQIVCQEGFDGGLEQSFIAEIYVHGQKNLFSSVSSK